MQFLRNLMSSIGLGATDSPRSPQSKNDEVLAHSHQTERSCDYNNVVPEVQVTHEGEAGLGQAFDMCRKNPGHPKFIPVKDFSIKDLPEDYRHWEVFDSIQAFQVLACRLKVTYVSPNRLEHFSISKIPYPCSTDKGKSSFHTGSGWVGNVISSAEAKKRRGNGRKHVPEHCECIECLNSDTPSEEWVEIEVYTARHVTFDDTEARETEVELFFDELDRSGVVKLQGLEMVVTGDIEEDNCWFVCHTHDMELGERLLDKVNEVKFPRLFPSLTYRYDWEIELYKKNVAVIVSHPHGCPKQISVGEWKEKQNTQGYNKWIHLTYGACTCPGSSGACVLTPNTRFLINGLVPAHKGCCENGLSISGLAYDTDMYVH